MSPKNFKDFLTFGLCLQTGPDSFKVMIGPFTLVSMEEIQASKSSTFLYKAEFWDFLKTPQSGTLNFVYKPREAFDLNREEIIGLLPKDRKIKPLFWQPAEESGFKEQFNWSQNLFKTSELKKTVPVILQKSNDKIDDDGKQAILAHLLKQRNFGWSYAYFENGAGIIGHTPEVLLEWSPNTKNASTVALAGTVANALGARTEIERDKKIRQEHDFVVDDLLQKLSGFSAIKENTEVLELKHLLHLQTKINFEIKNVNEFLTCAYILHPTAAMGVYPYNIEVLKKMADFPIQKSRGLFAGPLGVLGRDKSTVVVPIRGIILNQDGVSIFSGCGVTAESQYDLELIELENKRNSVKKMLGLMNDEF